MVDTATRTEATPDAGREPAASTTPEQIGSATPRVDVEKLGRQLLGTWADARLASRALSSRPEMQKVEGLSLDDQRARTFEQLKLLVENGQVHRAFPKSVGGQEDNGGNIAGFEELVAADPSLQIKSGVQWGLFGSAVLQLGTEYHHKKFLPGIMSLEVPGAFAMTETGHGSDVAAIGTTATYDPETQEFVIDTPFRAAWKDYLGNAAKHGTAAVVFAQLITKGVNHGVHAFYVPIRDARRRVPARHRRRGRRPQGRPERHRQRPAALHRRARPAHQPAQPYGDVAEDGTYTSSDRQPGPPLLHDARHARAGSRLARRRRRRGAARSASRSRSRYGNQRRQFTAGSDTDEEVHARLPAAPAPPASRCSRRPTRRASRTRSSSQKFDDVFSGTRRHGRRPPGPRDPRRRAQAALDLARARHPAGVPRGVRRRRASSPRTASRRLRADLDVYVTFEGDNNVLLQLVAKRLLTDYAASSRRRMPARSPATSSTQAAGTRLPRHRPAQRRPRRSTDFGSTARSVELAAGAEHAARAAHRPGRRR